MALQRSREGMALQGETTHRGYPCAIVKQVYGIKRDKVWGKLVT